MSVNEPLVSIAIPTYNRAGGTLHEALRSALAQTYPNLEVIVSDNSSDDDTPRLMAQVDDARFRYVRHERSLGANGNFNACLKAARGDYFLLLHDDDVLDADFVATCVAALPASGRVGVVRTGMRIIDSEGRTIQSLRNRSHATNLDEFVSDWFDGRTTLYFCNNLMRTDAVRKIGGFGTRHNLFQDVMAYVRLTAELGCVNVAEVKASFRRHDSNMGGAARLANWCEDSLEILDTICELATDPTLRDRGRRFLCRVNYSYVAAMESPWDRLNGYRLVSRYFDRCESPWQYAWSHDLRPRLRALKRRLLGSVRETSDLRAG